MKSIKNGCGTNPAYISQPKSDFQISAFTPAEQQQAQTAQAGQRQRGGLRHGINILLISQLSGLETR
jgi:hypothetical protein